MKKSCKKILAALLAVCMLACTLCVAYAEGEDETAAAAKAAYEGKAYTYFTDADTVLPGDAIVSAFNGNNAIPFGWNSLFKGSSTSEFLGTASNFYAAALVDILSISDYAVPEYTDTAISTYTTAFNNSVIDYLGYPGTEVKVGDIEKAITSVYDKYSISDRARAALSGDTLCPKAAELTAYIQIMRSYFATIDSNIDYLYWNCKEGTFQTALGFVKKVLTIAYEKTEEYIYKNQATDIVKILSEGFVANIVPAYLECIETEGLISNKIDYNKDLTILENFKSVQDECGKYYFALNWLTSSVEDVFAAAADASYTKMNEGTTDKEIHSAANDTIFRTDLIMAGAKYDAVLSAAFVTSAMTTTQNWYSMVTELISNIVIIDGDIKDMAKTTPLDVTWSAIGAAYIVMATDDYTGVRSNIIEKPVLITNGTASFKDLNYDAETVVWITTDDFGLLFSEHATDASGNVAIENIIPGTYTWTANNNDYGTLVVDAAGKATVTKIGNRADMPVSSEEKPDDNITSSEAGQNAGDPSTVTPGTTTTVPKTADNSVVLFAAIICVAAAAAYVFTKKVRG